MFASVIGGPGFSCATILTLAPHLVGGLVLAESDVNCVSQKVIGRPSQIGDLHEKLGLDPMDAGENERRAETA
jgi:hypothetical protein